LDQQSKNRELASTFVNICSVYSGMGKYLFFFNLSSRHDIALTYVKKAVEFMQEAYDHTLHTYTDPKEKR